MRVSTKSISSASFTCRCLGIHHLHTLFGPQYGLWAAFQTSVQNDDTDVDVGWKFDRLTVQEAGIPNWRPNIVRLLSEVIFAIDKNQVTKQVVEERIKVIYAESLLYK